jgi:hypothetical protein
VDALARGAIGRNDLDTLRDTLRREVAALTEAARRQLDDTLGVRLGEATAATTARIEELLKSLRRENARLNDLFEEQVESVARYRPGTIQTLEQQLAAERAEVERLREKLRDQAQTIDKREAEVARLRASEGAADSDLLQRRIEEVARLRSELDKRRDLEAERDDLRRRVGELEVLEARWKRQQQDYETDLELRREVEDLRSEVQQLSSDFDAARAAKERIAKQRDDFRERLARRGEQLDASRTQEAERSKQLAEHEQTLEALTAARDAAQTARDGAIARAAQAEARSTALQRELAEDARRQQEAREASHRQRMEAVRAEVERESQRTLSALEARLQQAEQARDEAQRRATQAETRATRNEQDALAAREAQRQWRADEGERQAQVRAYEVRVTGLQEEVQRTEARLDQLRAEAQRQRERLLDEAQAQQSALAERRAQALAEMEQLTVRIASLETTLSNLDAELGRRRGEAEAERAARVQILETPVLPPGGDATHPHEDEHAWLDDLRARMAQAGFQFSPRIVESFHTSLKIAAWAPLTVLAGVSGTGKSELPRLYSHFGGLRFLPVPVQPNWDSPQDLFGFFDYVGGRFRATTLVRAMVQSQRPREMGDGFDDGLLLVLLDEMNLARVELYFSELLSRLETRRGLDQAAARRQCAVSIDLGAGVEEYKLPLGENVLWAGTMNEDESTQTLSDKVLDRGNVLTFPRPRKLHPREEVPLGDAAAHLPWSTWKRWRRRPEETLDPDTRSTMREAVEDINKALGHVQRAVGHRVMQAIERYVANHPKVCGRKTRELTEAHWREPFEDQLVQKVMPKLRGVSVDTRTGHQCLDGVREVLTRSAEGLLEDFDRARAESQGAFVWNQASYLERGND